MKNFSSIFSVFVFIIIFQVAKGQEQKFTTLFETSLGKETPTYPQVVKFYTQLSDNYPEIKMIEMGKTDSGFPLHLIIYDPDKNFDFDELRKEKRILLINNGIHPGESDGIDATMMLIRDLAQDKIKTPEKTIIAAIPIYNIGGSLNRNSTSRTNQQGPVSYGFRGNARNFDLNRDFIKNDTKNAQSFAEIFHKVKPDIFVDNHVSNGADYQYVLTHLFTQHSKLGGPLGDYLHKTIQPALENSLAKKKWDITPYVNVWGTTPDKGWQQFMDYPRYSTGYTSLWNVIGMMVETHMLKPYKQRVEGTYELLKSLIEITEKENETIKKLRKEAFENFYGQDKYILDWKVDSTQYSNFKFKGYDGSYIKSKVTDQNRLFYDQTKPFEKEVTYYDYFKAKLEIDIPEAYLIPQGWWPIIDRLKLNQIEYEILQKDSTIVVESYRIKDYKTRKSAYEGHYMHSDTKVSTSLDTLIFKKGDYIFPLKQPGIRYIVETLEPTAPDSFFNWNFFDIILQQKEGFSPYVWEDKAEELLQQNSKLRSTFEEKKKSDPEFAKNAYAQLDWLHKQSENYEKAHLQYPVYRILK